MWPARQLRIPAPNAADGQATPTRTGRSDEFNLRKIVDARRAADHFLQRDGYKDGASGDITVAGHLRATSRDDRQNCNAETMQYPHCAMRNMNSDIRPDWEAGVVSGRLANLGPSNAMIASSANPNDLNGPSAPPYPLSTPPVAFITALTILALAASISASVSVFSRGCSVTSMARLFLPAAMRSPR